MTTEAPGPTPARRRRPGQAPAGRVLATGVALSATAALVAVMGIEPPAATGTPVVTVQPVTATPDPAPLATPPTTIVIIHRRSSAPASAASPTLAPAATAPAVGRATPAPRPAAPPPPAATTTGS